MYLRALDRLYCKIEARIASQYIVIWVEREKQGKTITLNKNYYNNIGYEEIYKSGLIFLISQRQLWFKFTINIHLEIHEIRMLDFGAQISSDALQTKCFR